jgi:hypothetical protein
MQTDFRRALARLVPVFMPELLFRLGPEGQPLFKCHHHAVCYVSQLLRQLGAQSYVSLLY